ncbi:MAG: histidine kinase [Chloroflexota bacterium]|nr:histidine kinase [Chloroflexota bacterium]
MFDRLSARMAALLSVSALALVAAGALASGLPRPASLFGPVVMALLIAGALWLRRQGAGPFRALAVPVAVATAMPIFGWLLRYFSWNDPLAGLSWVLGAAAAGVLGVAVAEWIEGRARRLAVATAAAFAVTAGTLGVLSALQGAYVDGLLSLSAGLSMALATAVPGLVAAGLRYTATAASAPWQGIVHALELALVGLTPALAAVVMWDALPSPSAFVPLSVWIVPALAVHFFAVRPLDRSAAAATSQRDLVVAAMESERSRIAADIHDDALQNLTLLAWQLDTAGNSEGARTAREIAERLRAICGDLRLPVLDDLGTGAALEWLVEHVAQLTGGEVRLERADQARPPSEVELAFFRVAQEAVSNAVRHGRPPIVVRYWTSRTAASLSVQDAGGGFDPARAASLGEGHFGLLNMRQRAEKIGALLDIRRWPQGGTQVTLDWRTA